MSVPQYPTLRSVQWECYPTLREMYAELARSTPRPLVVSLPMQAAETPGEDAQAATGTEPC